MKRAISLVAFVLCLIPQRAIPQTIESQSVIVYGASIEGKHLVVTGGRFQESAVVILNGNIQKTKNDPDWPTLNLLAKNAARRIAPDEIAFVQVQNPNGETSDSVPVYGGTNVFSKSPFTLWEIKLKVGQRFLLYLSNFADSNFEWHYSISGQEIIRPVSETQISNIAPGSVAKLFEAAGEGVAALYAIGDVPCTGPLCPGRPPTQLAVGISVK